MRRNQSEGDTIHELVERIQSKFSHDDIRDIYRIIHLLLDILTEDGPYKYHYNRHHIIMQCLYQFYAKYPYGKVAVHSYSVYVSERITERKKLEYKKGLEKRTSCSRCIIL